MTAAIDRFLYRATADTVTERIADAYIELQNAFDDLESFISKDRTSVSFRQSGMTRKQERTAVLNEILEARTALYAALEAAEAHVEDFVEANRP